MKLNHRTEPVGPLYNALLCTYIYSPPITPHCFLLYFCFCCILRLFLLKVFCLLRRSQFASNILFFVFYCLYLLLFQLLLSSILKRLHLCVSYGNSYDEMPGPAVMFTAVFAFFLLPIRFAVAFTAKLKEEAEIHLV